MGRGVSLRDYCLDLKRALSLAVETIEYFAVFDEQTIRARVRYFRNAAHEQAPLVDGSLDAIHRQVAFQRYVALLEGFVKKRALEDGAVGDEARSLLAMNGWRMQGPLPAIALRADRAANATCTANKNRRHEVYIRDGATYCRACGLVLAEK
jgi:hypothetical protein